MLYNCVLLLTPQRVCFDDTVLLQYDKKKKRAPSPDDNINAFVSALAQKWETLPPALVTSASTGYGKPELLRYIASMRMEFEKTALTDALM